MPSNNYSLLLAGALCIAGCLDSSFTSIEQTQLVPNFLGWREVRFSSEEGELLAKILVIGEQDTEDYRANTEYWFVSQEGFLVKPTTSNGGLYITVTDHDTEPPGPDLAWTDPPEPDQ